MKDCTHCKYADWQKTMAGKLHPSGYGHCKYPWKMKQLPASMYWSGSGSAPAPSGGIISRHKELGKDCAYWEYFGHPKIYGSRDLRKEQYEK